MSYTSVITEIGREWSSVTQATNHGLDTLARREILKTRRAKRVSFCGTMPLPMAVRTFSRLLVWHIAHNLAVIVHPKDPKELMTHTNFYSIQLADTITHMEAAFTMLEINSTPGMYHQRYCRSVPCSLSLAVLVTLPLKTVFVKSISTWPEERAPVAENES